MKCPFCSSTDIKVIDSRSAQKNTAIRRRRECVDCNNRFTTYEHIVEFPMFIIKSDGQREEFSREKLKKSLVIACNKRHISSNNIEDILMQIEKEIEEKIGAEVKSSQLGEIVLEKLKKIDDVAYIRFASVYKEFKDLDEFKNQINNIIDND